MSLEKKSNRNAISFYVLFLLSKAEKLVCGVSRLDSLVDSSSLKMLLSHLLTKEGVSAAEYNTK